MADLIEIRELVREYVLGDQVIRALDGVDLSIDSGEFVAIMGPSGSGSTKCLVG